MCGVGFPKESVHTRLQTGVLLPIASTLWCCPIPSHPLPCRLMGSPKSSNTEQSNNRRPSTLVHEGARRHRALLTVADLVELFFSDLCCRHEFEVSSR